jgi:hypothetical protein
MMQGEWSIETLPYNLGPDYFPAGLRDFTQSGLLVRVGFVRRKCAMRIPPKAVTPGGARY